MSLDALEFLLALDVKHLFHLLVGPVALSRGTPLVENVDFQRGHLLHQLVYFLDLQVVAYLRKVLDPLKKDLKLQ